MRHFLIPRNPSFLSTPYSLLPITHYTSSSSSSSSETSIATTATPHPNQTLTQEDLEKINLLLPRLCESNHLHEAIRLTDTVLLTNSPLHSISLPILTNHLSQQPTMTHTMALLNRLKHNPNPSPRSILHVSKLLISSYMKKKRFKEVMKILGWMWRADSICEGDEGLYGMVVKGLCRNYMVVEALGVVKRMVEDRVVVGCELRDLVYRGLLREARVKEALELNEGLSFDLVSDEEQMQRVVGLLDAIISQWRD